MADTADAKAADGVDAKPPSRWGRLRSTGGGSESRSSPTHVRLSKTVSAGAATTTRPAAPEVRRPSKSGGGVTVHVTEAELNPARLEVTRQPEDTATTQPRAMQQLKAATKQPEVTGQPEATRTPEMEARQPEMATRRPQVVTSQPEVARQPEATAAASSSEALNELRGELHAVTQQMQRVEARLDVMFRMFATFISGSGSRPGAAGDGGDSAELLVDLTGGGGVVRRSPPDPRSRGNSMDLTGAASVFSSRLNSVTSEDEIAGVTDAPSNQTISTDVTATLSPPPVSYTHLTLPTIYSV